MKIRSLLLGSVTAAGLLTSGAYAADLGVLTSLDVCDQLGLSGLTISSDTNCLQITGEVKYTFKWGDYDTTAAGSPVTIHTADDNWTTIGGDDSNDWNSRFDAWIKFVATADSDFGPAKAVLKLKEVSHTTAETGSAASASSDTTGVVLDEAYVSIGDSTVIIAGKAGSIMKKGDDEPLNWLGLFNSDNVDAGAGWGPHVDLDDGGHVIQVVSDLGNGFSIGAGLEDLNDEDSANTYSGYDGYRGAGSAVGVLSYAGDGISSHLTLVAGGVLDGEVEQWGFHAGFAGTFDNFKVVLAAAGSHDDYFGDYWNVLGSASATFDIFTIAGSFEAVHDDFGVNDDTDYGAGVSLSAAVTDGVTLNVGGRWYQQNQAGYGDAYQVAASVSAAVTESLTVTGEVGYIDDSVDTVVYGSGKLAWAPGGGYTSSVKATVTGGNDTADAAYKLETEFKKTFE